MVKTLDHPVATTPADLDAEERALVHRWGQGDRSVVPRLTEIALMVFAEERWRRLLDEERTATTGMKREAAYQAGLEEARAMVAGLERAWHAARAVVTSTGLPARESIETALLAGAMWYSCNLAFYVVTERAEFNVPFDIRQALGVGEVSAERTRGWRVWLQEQSRTAEKPWAALVARLQDARRGGSHGDV